MKPMTRHSKQSLSSTNSRAARAAHARGQREFRTYDTSALRPKPPKQQKIIAVVAVIVLVLVALFGVHFVISKVFNASSHDYTTVDDGIEVTVTIPEGASTNDIADALGKSGLIKSSREFKNRVKALDAESNLKPGTYYIVSGTSVDDIVAMLQKGPDFSGFTIPEGYTLTQIADAISQVTDGRISAKDFIEAASDASKYADDYDFLKDAGTNSLEGFLFPKTYEIRDSDTADTLIRTMLSQYATEVASLDYSYPTGQGLSAYDTLILASIIEKEADSENRAQVASVFYNRLAQGMRLQSDATVAYIVSDDPTPEDLEIDSPMNTYVVDGLPATPICSPSLESLQAACNPANTNYLYFYFAEDEKGNMVYSFSESYDEHMNAIDGDTSDSSSSGESSDSED